MRACLELFKSSCKCKKKKKGGKLMKQLEDCLITALQEISINTLKGNVELSKQQKRNLSKYKKALMRLSKHSTPRSVKRRIINQRGGGILSILLPTLVAAVAGLSNG